MQLIFLQHKAHFYPADRSALMICWVMRLDNGLCVLKTSSSSFFWTNQCGLIILLVSQMLARTNNACQSAVQRFLQFRCSVDEPRQQPVVPQCSERFSKQSLLSFQQVQAKFEWATARGSLPCFRHIGAAVEWPDLANKLALLSVIDRIRKSYHILKFACNSSNERNSGCHCICQ
jgi:hypothetical protein